MAPLCSIEPTGWPTILIGHGSDGPPYHLEVPRAVCPVHQLSFTPAIFLTPGASDYMRFLASSWGTPHPDFEKLDVEWRTLDDPTFLAFDGSEACFFAPEVVNTNR